MTEIMQHNISEEVPIGQVSFSVMARVAMQLGRESISNSIVAITELVKNAYDADAENIIIRFDGLDTNMPRLFITDDGNGMTRHQLENQWLVIGTKNKLMAGRSRQKDRILTGEKGLGRLGLDRLCRETVVQSFVENEDIGSKLVVDWSKYEGVDERLEAIKHDLFAIPKNNLSDSFLLNKPVTSGTQLILYGLKDLWTHDSLAQLHAELTLLVSPFLGTKDFSITLDSGMGWDNIDGKVISSAVLNAAEWKLSATLNARGQVSFDMSSNVYNDKFTFGPEEWNETFKNSRYNEPECGPLLFDMYFFPRRSIEIGELVLSQSQLVSFLNANNGIRIYRDHFRVKPYGAPDGTGDWLRLSYRRQQNPQAVTQRPIGSWKVGYNQVVGAVFISREQNANLIDQTNRENLVEGPAFSDMKMFVDKAIQFFEINRQNFEIAKEEHPSTEYEKAKEKVEKTSSATEESVGQVKDIIATILRETEGGASPSLNLLENLTETVNQIDDKLQQNRKAKEEYERQVKVQQEILQRQKDTLGNLASLGILATSFGHETLGSSNLVLINASDLHRDLGAGLFMVEPNVRSDVEEELAIILHEAGKIETFAKFMLRNVRRDKRNRQAINLVSIISRIFQSFEKLLDEKQIQVDLLLPDYPSQILAFEIDWESIFINLLTNSVWALENTLAGKKIIRVSVQEVEQKIIIDFSDSGIGIEKGTEDQIFLPTISTKRNEKGEVFGTGMGLAIARDFIESHDGGSIAVISPCDLGGASFRITLNVPNLPRRGQK